jgi:hypothetical protein
MPLSWDPNDYNDKDPAIKKFISELAQLTNDYSSYVARVVGISSLMIKDLKSRITLMEYQPINNKMIDRIDHRVKAGIPAELSAEYQSAINNFGPAINDSNIPVFIELLRKVFDSLFFKGKPDDSPLSHSEGLPNPQPEGHYLPTRDDFDNARRKFLRDGRKQISIDNILDVMEDNLVETGRSLAKEWRAVTRNNIILWTQEN